MAKVNAHKGAHKYYRVPVQGTNRVRWRCVLKNCPHWTPQEMIIGKLCVCWRCGEEFEMTKDSRLRKPHCDDCTKRKKDPNLEKALSEIEPSPI